MRESSRMDFMNDDQIEAKLEDFQIKKMIGQGSFGKVYLVAHNTTQDLYAMKVIRKDTILEQD